MPRQDPHAQAYPIITQSGEKSPSINWRMVVLLAALTVVAMVGAGLVGYKIGRESVSVAAFESRESRLAFRKPSFPKKKVYDQQMSAEVVNYRPCRDGPAASISRILAEMERVSDRMASANDRWHVSLEDEYTDYFDYNAEDMMSKSGIEEDRTDSGT